jgi:hypothetical protein
MVPMLSKCSTAGAWQAAKVHNVPCREQQASVNQEPAILSGRQCGACTVCCKLLPISTAEFKKTTNVLCVHCDEGRGCRIYQSRPGFCRSFYCDWRLNPQIPATWRPDKSGIFIQRIAREHIGEIGENYRSDHAILFVLLRPEAIERPALIDSIADYVSRCVPIFLSIPGPAGYLPAQIFLNAMMENAVARRDLHEMMIIVQQALEALKQQEFEPVPDLG